MEEWKDIPGYENLYQASNFGRIRSVDGKETSSARFPVRKWKQRIMKQKYANRVRGNGRDARVCLWKDGKGKTFLVSRLVALTWCCGFSEGMTVNHIDGNIENNNANNLEWVTHAENIRLGFETGLYSTAKKCLIKDDQGKILEFRSLSLTANYLGRSGKYVSNHMRSKKEMLSKDGKRYFVA